MYMVYLNPYRQAWLLYEAQIYELSHPYQQHMIDLCSPCIPLFPDWAHPDLVAQGALQGVRVPGHQQEARAHWTTQETLWCAQHFQGGWQDI